MTIRFLSRLQRTFFGEKRMGQDPKLEHASEQASPEAPSNGDGWVTAEESTAGEVAATAPPEGTVGSEPALETPTAPRAESAAEAGSAVSLIEELEALRKEKQELYDRLLRKQAEFENFRKRTEREKIESYDFAVANFILGLLPALDGLERGLSVSEGETVESYKKGIELILKQLRDQLASAGVQPIRVTGKMFDPNFHQAVMREENSVLPENEIIEEMQRGYMFKDRLLRPSMVKVAVAPAQPPDDEPSAPAEEAATRP